MELLPRTTHFHRCTKCPCRYDWHQHSKLQIAALALSLLIGLCISNNLKADPNSPYLLPSNQWHQISLPGAPPVGSSSLQSVFADDFGEAEYPTQWSVFSFDPDNNSYVRLALSDDLLPGVGYWIVQLTGKDVTLRMPAGSAEPVGKLGLGDRNDRFLTVDIADSGVSNWAMVGYSGLEPIPVSALKIMTNRAGGCQMGKLCTLAQAYEMNLAEFQLFGYNPSSASFDVLQGEQTLSPWGAYWFKSNLNNGVSYERQLLFPLTNKSPDCNGIPEIGDSGWVFDNAGDDSRYPQIREWVKAGVRGGVPCAASQSIVETVSPGGNIQAAIDRASRKGGGVVVLRSGLHRIDQTINMKSQVILRGENRDATRLEVTMRNPWTGPKSKKWAIHMRNLTGAGIENLTLFYSVPGFEPLDRNNFGEPKVNSAWPWKNDVKIKRGDLSKKVISDDNLYVGMIRMDNTKDSWVQNATLLESGSDPIAVDDKSAYITVRGNDIYRCYNKGEGGNCYVDIQGDHILFTNNTVRKIRHISVQLGAEYNVLYRNNFEVDVNFHNGDDGNNLVEGNQSKLPFVHFWSNIATGSPTFGHDLPGPNNILFANDAAHNRRDKLNIPDSKAVYQVTGYISVEKKGPSPRGGTFYPVKRE